MPKVFDQIPVAEKEEFLKALALGEYNVLLGAGASVGGKSSNGRRIPLAVPLTNELSKYFNLPEVNNANLKKVYKAAKRKGKVNGKTVDDYLRARFSQCTPPEWMESFVKIRWNTIWNLNIDDCVQRAYSKYSSVSVQEPLTRSWIEPHVVVNQAKNELLHVQLHGKADKASKKNELVFDISQYLGAVETKKPWHSIFSDTYYSSPFLIIGASLDEEIDLERIFEKGKFKVKTPSVIVLRDIDELQAEDFREYGLIPVRAEAGEFIEEVIGELESYVNDSSKSSELQANSGPIEAQNFSQQWLHLTPENMKSSDKRHDVYQGHEPRWSDAHSGKLMKRDIVDSVISNIVSRNSGDPNCKIHIISGRSFSGKTAVLLTLACDLGKNGFDVYLFRGNSSLDIEAVRWWVNRKPKSVLIIDNSADFAVEVKELIKESCDDLVRPVVVLSERDARVRHVENSLRGNPVASNRIQERASKSEAIALIGTLSRNRRLGFLRTKSRKERLEYFRDNTSSLFSLMAGLEYGRGFRERTLSEYDSQSSGSDSKALLGVLSVCAALRHALPNELVYSSTSIPPKSIESLLEGALGDVVYHDSKFTGLRHRYMGDLIVKEELSVEQKYQFSLSLARAIAPHYSIDSIRANNIYYRLGKSLMGRETLLEFFGNSRERVLDWYEALEDLYDWNARFWEQRALVAVEDKEYERALSWANEAVSRKEDSYTLHTVGKILMERAFFEASKGDDPWPIFEKAEDSLRKARDRDSSYEYPYGTFFGSTLKIARVCNASSYSRPHWVEVIWNEWYGSLVNIPEIERVRVLESAQAQNVEWGRL